MKYTLRDFLDSNLVPGIKLITKPFDFSKVYISSVSVQELPVDDFIRENEMVLSTAVGCLANEDVFFELIREVSTSNASVLFLAFRDPVYEVFPSVISYADSVSLPVFVLPWEYRFSDIQATVTHSILEKRNQIYKDLQDQLLDSFFRSESIDEAVNMVSRAFQFPILIEDENGNTVAVSKSYSHVNTDVEHWESKKVSIYIGSQPSGYLCFYDLSSVESHFDKIPVDVECEMLKKHICFPISLWLNRKKIEDITVTHLKNDFVWNLAVHNYDSLAEMIKQGATLGFNLNIPYTCVFLKLLPRGQGSVENEEYSSTTAADSAKIEEYLIQSSKRSGLRAMVSRRNLDFILYLENITIRPEKAVEDFVKEAHKRITQLFSSYDCYWGISETSLKKTDYAELYNNARLALQYCLRSKQSLYQLSYKDAQEAQIIDVLSHNKQIRKIAADILHPLETQNTDSNVDLLGTLYTYVKCNYNTSLTARTLFIHRQSLLYRLEKIENLLEMSLDNHQDLFLLGICLRVADTKYVEKESKRYS